MTTLIKTMPIRLFLAAFLFVTDFVDVRAADLRLGIIGTDTSHAVEFTKVLNDPANTNHVAGARVVAAFKGGSSDIPASFKKVEPNAAVMRDKYGVKICDSIEQVCAEVDAVLIESVDGRTHLSQVKLVIAAKKPFFIDKPLAANLHDALEIIGLTKAAGLPLFTASSLRFGKNTQAVRQGSIGRVLSAETFSPAHLEPTNPNLYWYGIHGCESLFTVLGTGCESVIQRTTSDGRIEVIGTWKGGRTGIFREAEPKTKVQYGGLAKGEKGESPVGTYDGYAPLVAEIVKFFQTGKSPVPTEETIELFAFMSAAEESKRQDGKPVTTTEVLAKARAKTPAKP